EPLRHNPEPPSLPLDRRRLVLALKDFWQAMTRDMRIVIAIDDVERVDEASGAVLANLAHRASKRSLDLIGSFDSESEPNATLKLIAADAMMFELQPLALADVQALVRSVFGDVSGAMMVAERVHESAEGKPRETMALLEHLVGQRMARYEAGAW